MLNFIFHRKESGASVHFDNPNNPNLTTLQNSEYFHLALGLIIKQLSYINVISEAVRAPNDCALAVLLK